jgi:hypothetical protein
LKETQLHIDWRAKRSKILPDFIIGGAMKSGTTTLHNILDRHPDISIANNELGFFDIDGLLQHPDFNFFDTKTQRWISQSIETNPDLFWNWYYSHFEQLNKENKLIGEDSTTYLTSRHAAKRIACQEKSIKLIFILRHPTKRTISNYLHLLKSGRAIYNLEDTLRYDPNSILRRSLYCEQLESYYQHLPFESIKVILFEDLIHNTKVCIQNVCEFLGVDFNRMAESDLEVHSNKTVVPKNISLQLWHNRWMQKSRDYRYSKFLPMQPEFKKRPPLKYRLIEAIHQRINPKKSTFKFVPNESTIQLLNAFFKVEMEEIDTITKQAIFSKWFKD